MANFEDELSPVLREGSLLADLPPACVEALSPLGQVRSYARGQTIFQKGDSGEFLGVLLKGRLRISTYSVDGTETVLNLLQAGDVVGEIATICGSERTADAIVMDDVSMLIVPRAALVRLMESDAAFCMALSRALAGKLRAASEALEASTLDMGRRVAAALVRLVEQDIAAASGDEDQHTLAIDQTTLARYAGLSRSNLNRVLKKFELVGASRHEKGTLEILDLEWLQDFAASEA